MGNNLGIETELESNRRAYTTHGIINHQ